MTQTDSERPGDADLSLAELHELACSVAREAGAMIASRRYTIGEVSSKASPIDLVTDVDRAAEQLITERLAAARPHDAIRGEEGTGVDGTSGVEWIVDPIDGTTSFFYGMPGFSVSIAATFERRAVVGVVYAPVLEAEYAAIVGRGATCNGSPIRCRDVDDLAATMAATGFAPDTERRRRQGEVFAALIPRIRDIRRMGSAALDLALVASGQVDAYYEVGLNPWDYIAGVLIAAEAGARTIVEPDGASGRSFVAAAAPGIAPELFSVLRELGADQV